MTERASLEETLEFCQKVRQAGGGAVLDALVPATPTDPSQCLIAKNLNFNCAVACYENQKWQMALEDKETRDKIALSLDLYAHPQSIADDDGDECWLVDLPENIGQVARDFDETLEIAGKLDYFINEDHIGATLEEVKEMYGLNFESDMQLMRDMWPYIDASTKEARDFGVFNENGELIL